MAPWSMVVGITMTTFAFSLTRLHLLARMTGPRVNPVPDPLISGDKCGDSRPKAVWHQLTRPQLRVVLGVPDGAARSMIHLSSLLVTTRISGVK